MEMKFFRIQDCNQEFLIPLAKFKYAALSVHRNDCGDHYIEIEFEDKIFGCKISNKQYYKFFEFLENYQKTFTLRTVCGCGCRQD